MTPSLPLLRLLGVPVRITCEDDEERRRLLLCYGASIAAEDPGGEEPLEAALEPQGDGWVIRVGGRPSRREAGRTEAVRSFNHELLHGLMLRAPHLYFVHAAVIAYGERGVVLPGLSRAGKSTLALALVEAGARYLSDELLAFDTERARALAFPRALKIRDECEAYFPRFAESWQGTGEGRFLPFEALPEDVIQSEAHVAAVVIPRWFDPGFDPGSARGSAEESELNRCQPITRGRALLDLAGSSLNFGTHRTHSLDCLARLVHEAACARVSWNDPQRTARSIADLLDEAGV